MIDGSCVDLLSAADDGFHAPGDDPWFFESSWWSFYVPERDLGAWMDTPEGRFACWAAARQVSEPVSGR